jgi:hypothetical protein
MNNDNDPRLAHTGRDVVGRELIDDTVLLADFERFLEHGEQAERDDDRAEPTQDQLEATMAAVWEFLGFIDRHGRQLLELAKRGAGIDE